MKMNKSDKRSRNISFMQFIFLPFLTYAIVRRRVL